jgi:hypothetical protein
MGEQTERIMRRWERSDIDDKDVVPQSRSVWREMQELSRRLDIFEWSGKPCESSPYERVAGDAFNAKGGVQAPDESATHSLQTGRTGSRAPTMNNPSPPTTARGESVESDGQRIVREWLGSERYAKLTEFSSEHWLIKEIDALTRCTPTRDPAEIGREYAERMARTSLYDGGWVVYFHGPAEMFRIVSRDKFDGVSLRVLRGLFAAAISAAITEDRQARATGPTRESVAGCVDVLRMNHPIAGWKLSQEEAIERVLALFSRAPNPQTKDA